MDGLTPVSVVFTPEGMLITSLKNKAGFQKTITWKELHKIGLKGKKVSGGELLKKIAKRAQDVVKGNLESLENHKKFMKDMKSLPRPKPIARTYIPAVPPPHPAAATS